MANKSQKLLCTNSALSIRNEISRFESVHPNIYAIYELLEQLDEVDLSDAIKNTIKDYVVAIEDSFVNSQEWTVPRFINILKLGIVGSISSGKSALVHRYLTGSYIQDESPEGGRFKKEVILDGISCLLLIRDEGACPDRQFTLWADSIIVVFSLENEESLAIANDYYQQMSSFRNTADIPILLVGTQDAISDSNPRLIDDSKARRMANSFGRAIYYETCATYGLNVDRVFLDVCSRMLVSCRTSIPIANNGLRSRPTTPQIHPTNVLQSIPYCQGAMTQPKRSMSNDANNNFSRIANPLNPQSQNHPHVTNKDDEPIPPPLPARPDNLSSVIRPVVDTRARFTQQMDNTQSHTEYESHLNSLPSPRNGGPYNLRQDNVGSHLYSEYNMLMSSSSLVTAPIVAPQSSLFDFAFHHRSEKSAASNGDGVIKEQTTPGGTPTQNRKNNRKSHLFKPHSDKDLTTLDKNRQQPVNGIGSGRSIPVKQGYLYKRSSNQINKERKNKKYVILVDAAKVIYYSTMNDYINQARGKEIDLQLTSVKIPGVAFRNNCLPSMSNQSIQSPSYNNSPACVRSNSLQDQESYEFILIGSDNKQWLFEAATLEERDDWILKIESSILQRLQLSPVISKQSADSVSASATGSTFFNNNTASQWRDAEKNNNNVSNNNNNGTTLSVEAITSIIRSIAGNDQCCDCASLEPRWASLNLGISICMECSGVHRQMGTHVSRVRSLQLDEWSKEQLSVMKAIGNTVANSVWEASVHASSLRKPEPDSPRAAKEAWIRAKYEQKQFLPPLPYLNAPIQQQLIDAITRQDTRQVILCLVLAGDTINHCYSDQDPRTAIHIAATLGHIVYLQLILWYNGNAAVTDTEGRNAFFYAYYSGQMDCADFLLRNSCVSVGRQTSNCSTDECHSRSQSSSSAAATATMASSQHHQQQQKVSSHAGTMPRHRHRHNDSRPLPFTDPPIDHGQMIAVSRSRFD